MANANPSTPVRVPSSAASYTPATLDPDLRSQINAILWKDGHVTKIQERLLHSLNANSHNWPTLVQAHALALLRSGEVTNFPALLRRVIDDVRQDTAAASSGSSSSASSSSLATSASSATGTTATSTSTTATTPAKVISVDVNGNGSSSSKVNGDTPGGGQQQTHTSSGGSLALPPAVMAEALKVARESLEMVCEVEENGAT